MVNYWLDRKFGRLFVVGAIVIERWVRFPVKMTIGGVTNQHHFLCQWFEGDVLKHKYFHRSQLKLV